MVYHVNRIVSNGKDAIEETTENHPDFILMDINIKGLMNGIETAKEIYNKHAWLNYKDLFFITYIHSKR